LLKSCSNFVSDSDYIGSLDITFFRPTPIGSFLNCTIPIYSAGHITVACLGVIENLPEIRETLISYGYEFNSKKKNGAETLSYLFNNYLDYCVLSPVDAMEVMMKKLKAFRPHGISCRREMVDGGMS
jgi:hypothetical protein